MIFALIGSIALGIQILLYLLMVLGVPIASITLDDKYKILPKEFRGAYLASIVTQILILLTLLQSGSILSLPFPGIITRILAVLFALFLTFNAIKIFAAGQSPERKIIFPLTAITALSFFATISTVPISP
jgi:hypothetical protein